MNKKKQIRNLRVFLATLMSLLFLSHGSIFAQNTLRVSGTVFDNTGEPLIGASIIEKGTTNGTSADLDGKFVLNVQPNATLVFSMVSFKTQEIPVNGKTEFNVTLSEDNVLLKEVMVIGYGSVKKEDLTGSVIAIKAEDMNRGAVTSPQQLLQGKVSGVFVQPSTGQPGGGATLRIRSGASLSVSNDPLIVIDGVPVSNDAAPGMANPLAAINPNDIETFTILKDASATAIYGSRASNGVIIITTKKGAVGKVKVSYSSTYSFNDPYKKVGTLNAREYREVVSNTFGDNATAMNLLNQYSDINTNWQDKIYKTAFGTDQNISVSGGLFKKIPFRASFGYNNEDGTLKTSNYERYTADVSLTPKFFNDHLSVTLNVKGVINNNKFANTGAIGAAAYYDPTKPMYNETGETNGYWNWTNSAGELNTIASGNPMQVLFDRFDSGKTRRSIGNLQLDYKFHFLPELRANLNLGYDVARGEGNKGPNINSFDAEKDDLAKGVGRREFWSNFRRNQLLEYYMNYEKEFPAIKSRLNVMGGYSHQHFYYSNLNKIYSPKVTGYPGINDDSWQFVESENAYVKDGSYTKPGESYLISFFGRLNYVFNDRYLLTATVRRDGSSKFVNHWGTFPSLAAAWTISQESFMKDINFLSNLKLRLGYGSTGQQDMNDYVALPIYYMGSNPESIYLDQWLLKPGGYNPSLKWETTDTYNIALDYGFLNNRINGSIEYYKKKTKDLLSMLDVPSGTNFVNRIMQNIGRMENNGVEFNINAAVISTRDFTWDAGFNFTWNKSEITQLVRSGNSTYEGTVAGPDVGTGTGTNIQKHVVGQTPYTFYTYQQVYDTNGKPIQNAFVDRNNDGRITEADRYLTGKSPMPKYFMGFNSHFTYKQFDLGFNLRANFDNYVFNATAAGNSTAASAYGGQGFLSNLHKSIYKTGFTKTNSTQQITSDYFLENASFLKMDNITLGYSFSNAFKSGISGRLSFSVQNVFTITDYSGMDPEVNEGVDKNIWPRPRTYTVGLNLNF